MFLSTKVTKETYLKLSLFMINYCNCCNDTEVGKRTMEIFLIILPTFDTPRFHNRLFANNHVSCSSTNSHVFCSSYMFTYFSNPK